MLKVVNASDVDKAWADRTIAEQRNLLGLLIESITIFPTKVRGSKSFDPERVRINFR